MDLLALESIPAVIWIVGAWIIVCALFIFPPVATSLRADYRQLRAGAIPNAGRVIRRRFFIRSAKNIGLYRLPGCGVWVDWWTPDQQHGKYIGRVATLAEDGMSLVIEEERARVVFRPRRLSRRFAAGQGAATGALCLESGERIASALVVML